MSDQPQTPQTPSHTGGVSLPPTLRFLNAGWWVLHIVAIALVFGIGYWIGTM